MTENSIQRITPLWTRYAGKFIQWTTMPKDVRTPAIFSLCLSLGSLLILGFNIKALPGVLLRHQEITVTVPWIVLIPSLILVVGGWCFLVTGAVKSCWYVKWPVVLIFTAFGVSMGIGAEQRFLVVPLIYIVGYAIIVSIRRNSAPLTGRMAAVGAIIAGYFLLSMAAHPAAMPFLVYKHVFASFFLFIPIIYYFGVDVGDSLHDLTRWAIERVAIRLNTTILWSIALVIIAVKSVWLLFIGPALGWNWVMALVVLIIGLVLAKRLCPQEAEPPAAIVLFLAGVLFFGQIMGSRILGSNERAVVAGWSWVAICALAAGAVLAVRAFWRQRIAGVTLYLLLFGFWNLVHFATFLSGNPVYDFINRVCPINIQLAVTSRGLDFAITLASLIYLIWIRMTRRATPARILLGLFAVVSATVILRMWQFLEWMSDLPGGFPMGQAIILIIGISWDMITKGNWFNRDTKNISRSSRVLLYVGAVMVLCGSLLLANGSDGPLGSFETDTLQQIGLIFLGIPLFLQQLMHAYTNQQVNL